MQKEDIIDWQDLVSSHSHLFGPIKEGLRGKHFASKEKVKVAVMKCLKEQSTEFSERYMFSFEGGTLLLREMVMY